MRRTVSLLLAALITVGSAAAKPPVPPRVAGTYSNLTYNEEGGDLLGLEISIIPIAGERYQAVIVVSEGEPQPLHVVEVRVRGTEVSFTVPETDDDERWSFRGRVSAKSLTGKITRSNGSETVTLARNCGYWN